MSEISAGAVIYTVINNEIYYLISKDFHNNYGFAKGHLEENETEKQAAIREIKEEVGIDINLDINFKEELNYIMPNGIHKRSIYFIGSYDSQNPTKQLEEVQEIKLLRYEDALDILTFENMKEVLRKADRYIHEKQRTVTED